MMYEKIIDWSLASALTIFACVLIVGYWSWYGPQNFVWFSDLGLFLLTYALWTKSAFIISLLAITILPLEIVWNIDFILLLSGARFGLNMTKYMVDTKLSLFVRCLSLFHVFMPILIIYYLTAWGYDERVFPYALTYVWLVLLATYFLTDPKKNVNWVFMPLVYGWPISPLAWLVILLIAFPMLIILPMHLLMMYLFYGT